MSLKNKVIIITGSTRGIGREFALRFARAGAKVVVTGKSTQEGGKLPGTIYAVAEEIKSAGGTAAAFPLDVRHDESILDVVEKTVQTFGRIDGLINNAGAITLTSLEETPMKKVDLVMGVNVRAVLACVYYCLPHLKKAGQGHILNLSPPLCLDPHWISGKTPYTISKYGMTLATLGLADELKKYKIAVNSLWPRMLIASAATKMILGEEGMKSCRTPAIMADAAYEIFTSDPSQVTGQVFIDETLLKSRGTTDFDKYKVDPEGELAMDYYVEE